MRTFASGARLRVVLRIAAIAVLTAALGAQTPVPSERERADAAAKRTADRLRALQRESDALAAQERTLLADLRKLEVDRQIAIENLSRIERDLAATSKKLDDAEARAAELARTAAAQLPDVEARLVQLYKLGGAGPRLPDRLDPDGDRPRTRRGALRHARRPRARAQDTPRANQGARRLESRGKPGEDGARQGGQRPHDAGRGD
jgi:septal ring factor EnvC (AmiA/AmiB activator)